MVKLVHSDYAETSTIGHSLLHPVTCGEYYLTNYYCYSGEVERVHLPGVSFDRHAIVNQCLQWL